MEPEDFERAPVAMSVVVFHCGRPECQRPHIALLNEEREPLAHFVVDDNTHFLKSLQEALATVEQGEIENG